MHPQLELLLEIQDLKVQRRGLEDGSLGEMESDVFDIRVEDAIEALSDKIVELEGRLSPSVTERYQLISGRGLRVVVPVLNRICYGCFVAVATAKSSESDRNERVESCEHCGRFLYHVD